MNSDERLLVVLLSAALAFFLILGIAVLIMVIQLINKIKRIADKAEEIADKAEAIAGKAEAVGDFFQKTAGPAALLKALSSIARTVRKHKNKE